MQILLLLFFFFYCAILSLCFVATCGQASDAHSSFQRSHLQLHMHQLRRNPRRQIDRLVGCVLLRVAQKHDVFFFTRELWGNFRTEIKAKQWTSEVFIDPLNVGGRKPTYIVYSIYISLSEKIIMFFLKSDWRRHGIHLKIPPNHRFW